MAPVIEWIARLPDFCKKLYTVRRFLLLFLVVHLLSGNMLADELGKLPYLVRHFQVHQQQNFGSTLLDFLRLHYTNALHRRSDPDHRQLPLQHLGIHSISSSILPESGQMVANAANAAQNSALLPTEDNLLPSDFREGLLRPPQRFLGF